MHSDAVARRALAGALAAAAIFVSCGQGRLEVSDPLRRAGFDAGSAGELDGGGLDGGTPDGGAEGGSDGGTVLGCGDPFDLVPDWARHPKISAEIYVSPTGSDSNGGTDRAHPLRTPAKALTRLAPGVRLNFAPGTYSGCGGISNFPGTATAPGVIRTDGDGAQARFDCQGGTFALELVHYIVFDNVEIFDAGGHGIHIASGEGPWTSGTLSSHVALLRSYVHDTAIASIKANQAEFIYVVGNRFTRAGGMLVEFVAADDTVVAGNEAFGQPSYFNEVKGGSRRSLIYRNYLHDTGRIGHGGGILVGGDTTGYTFLVHQDATYEASEVQVWDNAIVNDNPEAFRIVACHDCTVANNTFWTTGTADNALRLRSSSFPGAPTATTLHNQNLKVENNVFAALGGFNYVISSDPAEGIPVGLLLSHNAWVGVAGRLSDVPFRGDPASLYEVDLKLAAPPADLTPAPGSPLLDAGAPISLVRSNAAGACWAGAPNIGAY